MDVMKAGKAPKLDGVEAKCCMKDRLTKIEGFKCMFFYLEWGNQLVQKVYYAAVCRKRVRSMHVVFREVIRRPCVLGKLYGCVFIPVIRSIRDDDTSEERLAFKKNRTA